MKQDSHNIKEQVKQLAANAEAELEDLLSMRAELDQEIVRLRHILKGLQPVLDDDYKAGQGSKRPGIKQMCLEVLQTAYEALTATEVVNELKEIGFPIDNYEKPLAVISITLKRLVTSGEAKEESKAGKTAYKWNPKGKRLRLPNLDKFKRAKL